MLKFNFLRSQLLIGIHSATGRVLRQAQEKFKISLKSDYKSISPPSTMGSSKIPVYLYSGVI